MIITKKHVTPLIIALLGIMSYQLWKKPEISFVHDDSLILYGNVDIRDVALGFRVSGRIAEMRYEEGDFIEKGAVVATLDRDLFENDFAVYKAEAEQAAANLNNAMRNFSRIDNLLNSGAVSQKNHEDAIAARDTAIAFYATTVARKDKALTRLNDTEIKAPAAGTILTRIQEPGAIVAEGTSVYNLSLDKPVWIRAYISENDLGLIYPGQKALIFSDTHPDKPYEGQVGFISPQAEFTPKNVETAQLRTDLVYRLRITVNQPDSGLRQGMPVSVQILLKKEDKS